MEPAIPGAHRHFTARRFIHNHHLAFFDNIVAALFKKFASHKSLTHQIFKEPGARKYRRFLQIFEAFFKVYNKSNRAVPEIYRVVDIALQLCRNGIGNFAGFVEIRVFFFARNNERSHRLVNEHVVGLVDNRRTKPALHQILRHLFKIQHGPVRQTLGKTLVATHGNAVAQKIGQDLFRRRIRDIGFVASATFHRFHGTGNSPHRHAAKRIKRLHDFGIARGQVIVCRNHMARAFAPAAHRGAHSSGHCLALTRRHFGNVTPVQG